MRSAWSAKTASTRTRSTGTGGLDVDRMRRVWVGRLDRNRHLFDRGAKCDRSETFCDRPRFVELLRMIGAPEGGQDASVVGERNGALVVQSQRRERLDRVEDQLLGPRELAALHRADSLSLR